MDELSSRIAITSGALAAGWGISRRWWVAAIAGCLAWKYSEHATMALSAFLVIVGAWHFLLRRAWPAKPEIQRSESCDDGDIIDADFEVKHGP
jgi:hypothetical protein